MTYPTANRVYCVSYDLKMPGRNYEPLFEALKKNQKWWHYLQSTWLVLTPETPQQLWNRVANTIDTNDYLLIIEVRDNCQGWLPKEAWDWIHTNVPSP